MPIIAVISDIHVGHPCAVWPDNFYTDNGNEIAPNPAQRVLLEYWHDFFSQPDVNSAEYIVNLEESVEGYNRKEHGHDIMATDLNVQARAFCQLLSPYMCDQEYLALEGSGYHGSDDTSVSKSICQILGGHYMGVVCNWEVKGTGKIIHMTHKSSGAMLYKATALDRNSLVPSIYCPKCGTTTPLHMVTSLTHCPFCHKEYEHEG